MSVRGMGEVLKALKAYNTKKRVARRVALTRIGLKVKGDSLRFTPVDTGNLRASAFSEVQGGEFVRIGYTAAYAPFVHESMEKHKGQPRTGGTKKGFYWESGQPKFLEKAVKDNAAFILKELAKAHKI